MPSDPNQHLLQPQTHQSSFSDNGLHIGLKPSGNGDVASALDLQFRHCLGWVGSFKFSSSGFEFGAGSIFVWTSQVTEGKPKRAPDNSAKKKRTVTVIA